MKLILVLTTALCVSTVSAYPFSEGERLRSEALDRLVMVEADNETALRSKRTIGILRELFPEVSQMVEEKVNMIVAEVIRALGPTVLRNFIGNTQQRGGSSSGGSTATAASPFDDYEDEFNSTSDNGSKVSVSLPTFPPDDNDEDTDAANNSSTTSQTTVDTSSSTITPDDSTTDAVNTVV